MHKCKFCGEPATHQFKSSGEWCCEDHDSKCPAQKEKKRQTCLENHGVENAFQSPEVREIYKKTCLKIYGFENAFQSLEVQNKYKQNCLDKYGVESPMQLKEVQEKHYQTRLKNHPPKPKPKKIEKKPIRWKFDLSEKVCKFCGAPAIYQFKNGEWCCKTRSSSCPAVKKKQSQGWTDEVDKRRKQTCIEKHGVESVMQIKEVKEKKDETMLDKYGTRIYANTTEFKDLMILTQSGENNPAWKGGISFEPYCQVWTDKEYKASIRQRDGYTCQHCGITEQLSLIVYGRILCIHHINYDKKDCTLKNLITTCVSCNAKANVNRSEWTLYYQKIITERIYPGC